MVGPVADTEGDEDIGVGIGDIIEPARRQDAQRHVGIHFLEAADMRAQPQRGKARRAADAERAADRRAAVLGAGIAEHRQRLAHVERVAAAARGQRDALADALQHLEAEVALEQAQLMADGAAGQMQLIGGAPDAAVAGEAVQRPAAPGSTGFAMVFP